MPVYSALLRAVNVGGRNMNMAELRSLCNSLGFTSTQTLLQSGNLAFTTSISDPAQVAQQLEQAIEAQFGYFSKVFIRSTADLRDILVRNPFPRQASEDPAHLVVMFCAAELDPADIDALKASYSGPEAIQPGGRELYIYYPAGIGRSKLTNVLLEKKLNTAGTARNWNSVSKLLALAEQVEASE